MKRLLKHLCTLGLILLTLNGFGQSDTQSVVMKPIDMLGITYGRNWSNVTGNDYFTGKDNLPGIALGLSYHVMFGRNGIAGFEVLYDERGFTYPIRISDSTGTVIGKPKPPRLYYDYISLPLSAGFVYGKNFFGLLNLAVCPSILIGAAASVPPGNDGYEHLGYDQDDIFTEQVSRYDLAGRIECGIGYRLDNGIWLTSTFSLQRSWSTFTNSLYYPNEEGRHKVVRLSFGLRYSLVNADDEEGDEIEDP